MLCRYLLCHFCYSLMLCGLGTLFFAVLAAIDCYNPLCFFLQILKMFDLFPQMSSNFSMTYNCYSHSCTPGKAREDIKDGGKILLPPSALEFLTRINAMNPMIFKLVNAKANRSTHCGVLEFVADEGNIYVPYWMMQSLCLQEGDPVLVRSVALPVASFAKFQPQSVSFLDITNPKAVLEYALRKFACLTVNDVIPITYNDAMFELKVLELKPSDAVSIIECDMNVDFAAPVGYKDDYVPKAKKPPTTEEGNDHLIPKEAKGTKVFGGPGKRLDGRRSNSHEKEPGTSATQPEVISTRGVPNYDYEPGTLTFLRIAKTGDENDEVPNFEPFKGEGMKLKPPAGRP